MRTNLIEGVWSLFKRSIMGSFHKVSVKHLDRYLAELEWRFNNRKNDRTGPPANNRFMASRIARSSRSSAVTPHPFAAIRFVRAWR